MQKIIRFVCKIYNMKKLLPLLFFLAVVLTIFSCVPPDPNAVYGTGQNITGPRILYKVDSADVNIATFFHTGSKLTGSHQTQYNAQGALNNTDISITYNSDNKISKIVLETGPVSSTTQFENLIFTVNLTYDGSGKVISSTGIMETIISGQLGLRTKYLGSYTYDASGNLVKALQKFGVQIPTTSNYEMLNYFQDEFTYSGQNISDVVTKLGSLDSSGNLVANAQLYNEVHLSNFDNKINPYTTFPKEFAFLQGILSGAGFIVNNQNNHGTMVTTHHLTGSPVSNTQNFVMHYDLQNYLIQGNYYKFIYDPI